MLLLPFFFPFRFRYSSHYLLDLIFFIIIITTTLQHSEIILFYFVSSHLVSSSFNCLLFCNQMLIVLTDGEQTKRGQWTPLGLASRYVKEKGVRVFSMGIGKSVSRDELNQISSNPSRNVFTAKSFRTLEPVIQQIIDTVCFPGKFCSLRDERGRMFPAGRGFFSFVLGLVGKRSLCPESLFYCWSNHRP